MKNKVSLFVSVFVLVAAACAVMIPQAVEANLGETAYIVEVTANTNKVSHNYVPLSFDGIRFGLNNMWSSSDPTKLVIPVTGIWEVGAEITTLGLNYVSIGGTQNDRVILNIVKNWDGLESTFLYSTVCAERFEPQNMYAANLNSTSCPLYLEQGSKLELVIIGRGNLLVESNPGNTGLMSPHFYAHYLGAHP